MSQPESTPSATPILEITNLHVSYGAVQAVREVSLKVMPNQVVAVLGANGAGKSSTVRAICGAVPSTAESVRYLGREYGRRRPYEMARAGLVLVPEGRKIIGPLKVEENLLLGGFTVGGRRKLAKVLEEIYELFPDLARPGRTSRADCSAAASSRCSRSVER